MNPSHSAWTPPDYDWSPTPRASWSGSAEWGWPLVASSLLHAAACAALIQTGVGAGVQTWSPSPGPSSIELALSFAAAPNPQTGEPEKNLETTVQLELPGEAAPRGAEQATEATTASIDRQPARLSDQRTVQDAAPELPLVQLELAQGSRAESRQAVKPGAPPAVLSEPRPAAQPQPASSASLPQDPSRAAQGVDSLPQAIQNPAPAYPADLLAARIEGRVVLRVVVRADGTVAEASVHVSSGRQAFDDAASATLRRWRFTPAVRNGAAVQHAIAVPIRFVIGVASQ